MISEQTLVFSSFDRNKLEYYRNMLLLIILKRIFYPTNLRALTYVNNFQPKLDTYINICPQNAFHSLVSASLHLSLLTFHVYFTFLPSHHSQLTSHATSCLMCSTSISTFSAFFQNRTFDLFCLSCHVWIIENLSNYNHKHNTNFASPNRGHVKCQHAMCRHKPRSTVGQK